MSLEQPPIEPAVSRRFGDDLDGQLGAFFCSQMPTPWPVCPAPPTYTVLASPLTAPSRWAMARSRFALAASVALLVAGLWAIGGKVSQSMDSNANPRDTQPSATRPNMEEMIEVKDGVGSYKIVFPR